MERMNPLRIERNELIERIWQVAIWGCLATTYALVVLLATAYRASAQWSTDPAAPLVVCNANGNQTKLRALPDGTGGWYAFWLDDRTDGINAEVYGQRYDAEGYAQWTANGKLMVTLPGENIKELTAALLDNGNVVLAYIQGPSVYTNAIHAMAFDPTGDPAWGTPTVIDEVGNGVLGLDQVNAIPAAGGAFLGWYDNFQGGGNLINVSRISSDGSLPWGTGGQYVEGGFYGPFELHSDGTNGMLVQWRTGNGTGAALYAMQVDANGAEAWADTVRVSANSPGLNYGFHTVEMGGGTQVTAWRDVPGNIVMARLDHTGALTYPASPLPVCTYASYHDLPKLAVSDGALFAAWLDNRPPANTGDLYLQKFDADGTPTWTVEGVLALQIQTNFATTGMIASDSGAVIVMMDSYVEGYAAMRIRTDGTQAWSTYGLFCTAPFRPFYTERTEMPDGDGGVVSFWRSWDGDLYAGRILRTGTLAGTTMVSENASFATIAAYPNPAQDRITFNLTSGERAAHVEVINSMGAVVQHESSARTIDVQELAQGAYLVRIRTNAGFRYARFIKHYSQ